MRFRSAPIRVSVRLTALLGLATLSSAGGFATDGPGESAKGQERVRTEPLAASPYSRLEQTARVVIRDQAEWERYRELLALPSGGGVSTPVVDFERDMVILVAMGQKPSGGYDIEVSQVVTGDTLLSVTVTETAPGRSCMTTQAFTAPALAVRLARYQGQVRFMETKRTRECR